MKLLDIVEDVLDGIETRVLGSGASQSKRYIFYLAIIGAAMVAMLLIVTFTSTDSLNPMALLEDSRPISYIGSPEHARMGNYSGEITLGGLHNTSMGLDGDWAIRLDPRSQVQLIAAGGSATDMSGIESIRPRSPDSSNGHIYVNEAGITYNDYRITCNKSYVSLVKSLGMYCLLARWSDSCTFSSDLPDTQYSVSLGEKNAVKDLVLSGPGGNSSFQGHIVFSGPVTITMAGPDNSFRWYASAFDFYPAGVDLHGGRGDLSVSNRPVIHTPADFVGLRTGQSFLVSLAEGKLAIIGRANSVIVNDREMLASPISRLIKESYFPALIGILFGLVLLLAHRLLKKEK